MINPEKKDRIIKEEAKQLHIRAENAVCWCNPNRIQNDVYWAEAYKGERFYRLIVQQGFIVGSVPDGFHGSKPVGVDFRAWQMALIDVIQSKIGHHFYLIRAAGRNGSFFLQSTLYLPYFRNVMIHRITDENGSETVQYEVH